MLPDAPSSCITHTVYFGDIYLYYWIARTGLVILEKQENYQKKSGRNRNLVASPQETALLSVPLTKGKNKGTGITHVHISYDEAWQEQHLRTLQMGYSNSPFYEYYIDDIAAILGQQHTLLWNLNMDLLRYILKVMDIEASIHFTDAFQLQYPDEILDLRGYQKEQTPSLDCIFGRYRQPFDDSFDFQENLSILDLLFCKGPESILYLEKNISCKTLPTKK